MSDELRYRSSATGLSINYNPKSKELRLTCVENISGRELVLDLDSHATRALYDLLNQAADMLQAPLGEDAVTSPKLQ